MIDTKIDLNDEKMIKLREFMDKVKYNPHPESYLIGILHKAQELYGYLDRAVMDEIALTMNIPTSHIWGVATFYHYFTLKPRGKHLISVCLGTACYIKGADKVLNA
ncbi:MAG: NAD(P)H-dependent oxidoreductase subunit E, partial [Candidatus Eremiobacterota bacterium]